MPLLDILAAVAIACVVMAAIYLMARHVARHEHIPTPSGRCLACGLDATQEY